MLYHHHGSDSQPLQIYGSLKHEWIMGGHKNTHKLVEDIVVFTWHKCYAVTLCFSQMFSGVPSAGIHSLARSVHLQKWAGDSLCW